MGLVDTPVNAALALYIVYGVGKLLFPPVPKQSAKVTSDPNESYTWMPRAHPPSLVFQTYTPKTLAKHNGQNGERIMLAIKGMVFDVTAGGSFYGPGAVLGSPCLEKLPPYVRSCFQAAHMATSLAATRRVGWRSNPLTKVQPLSCARQDADKTQTC